LRLHRRIHRCRDSIRRRIVAVGGGRLQAAGADQRPRPGRLDRALVAVVLRFFACSRSAPDIKDIIMRFWLLQDHYRAA
jgi:hypothetical protein